MQIWNPAVLTTDRQLLTDSYSQLFTATGCSTQRGTCSGIGGKKVLTPSFENTRLKEVREMRESGGRKAGIKNNKLKQ